MKKEASVMRVDMPDGSAWEIPLDAVLEDMAEHLTELLGLPEEAAQETLEELADVNELVEWATENMDWADVSDSATRVVPPKLESYADAWVNAPKEVAERSTWPRADGAEERTQRVHAHRFSTAWRVSEELARAGCADLSLLVSAVSGALMSGFGARFPAVTGSLANALEAFLDACGGVPPNARADTAEVCARPEGRWNLLERGVTLRRLHRDITDLSSNSNLNGEDLEEMRAAVLQLAETRNGGAS